MSADNGVEQWREACTVYHRDVALAHLDAPPGAGREARLAQAIARCAEVCSAPALAVLQSVIDTAPASQQETLHRLRAWGLRMHLQGTMLPYQRQMRARQRAMTCHVGEEPIPLLASFSALATESRRDRRAAIETAISEQLETLAELFEAQFEALRNAGQQLGYDSLESLWNTISGVELAAQQDVVTELLQETQSAYVELLTWAVQGRLRLPLAQLRRHDILALFTFSEYQQYYQPGFTVPSLQACLQDLGIDPWADRRLIWRQHSGALGPPFAVAVELPNEIVLSYSHAGGLQEADACASACGRALLWAYTSSDLELTSRLLGDAAIPTSSAQFMAEVIAHPLWLRRYARLSVDGNYEPWRRLDRLYRLRRQLGRFLFARHLYTSDSLAGAAEVYRDIMMEACLVDYVPAYYLTDWDWQYTSLALWRGWSLASLLLDTLREDFASDWFWNPESGTWLLQYWHQALAHGVDDLLHGLRGVAWDVPTFAASLCDEGGG